MSPTTAALLRKNIVAKALSHVGEVEHAGSAVVHGVENSDWGNRGVLMDAALAYVGDPPGVAWCAAAACYFAGKTAESMGLAFGDLSLRRTGYCPDQANHARALGTLVLGPDIFSGNAISLEPGDQMLEWIPSLGDYHHAETVVTPPKQGVAFFATVGGNTVPDGYSGGHESQGCGVFLRHRNCTDRCPNGHPLYAFVRLLK